MELIQLAQRIARESGVALAPASKSAIAMLTALGAPNDVTDFFSRFEPSRFIEVSRVRLWPIADLVQENTNLVPGSVLHPRGFLVIGSTDCGDAYCVDIRGDRTASSQVLLMAHELDWEEISDGELQSLQKVVAKTFLEFLVLFIAGHLDQEALYEPKAG